MEIAAEYVLDGLSAWTGAHRARLRWALDDAPGRYDVLVWALGRVDRCRIEPTLRAMRQLRVRGVQVVLVRCSSPECHRLSSGR